MSYSKFRVNKYICVQGTGLGVRVVPRLREPRLPLMPPPVRVTHRAPCRLSAGGHRSPKNKTRKCRSRSLVIQTARYLGSSTRNGVVFVLARANFHEASLFVSRLFGIGSIITGTGGPPSSFLLSSSLVTRTASSRSAATFALRKLSCGSLATRRMVKTTVCTG